MDELLIMRPEEIREFFIDVTRELRLLRSEFETFRKREESLKTYSVKEAARILRLHRNTVRNLVTRGELAPCWLDRKRGSYKISELSLRAYLLGKKIKESTLNPLSHD